MSAGDSTRANDFQPVFLMNAASQRRINLLMIAVLWATWADASRASVYITGAVDPDVRSARQIQTHRDDLLSIASQKETRERKKFLQRVAELEFKRQTGWFSAIDRADLGGCLLRLGKPAEAVAVLSGGDNDNFIVLCNLAAAQYSLAVSPEGNGVRRKNLVAEAVSTQRRALAAWPSSGWTGWTDEQWYFYRRVELLHLQLLKLRELEWPGDNPDPPTWKSYDLLFPRARFVGPSGVYEAGRIAPAMLDEFPDDAPSLVRQLVFTYPSDVRLYWLLGELFNSRCLVKDAFEIFKELVDVYKLSGVELLNEHRRVLFQRIVEIDQVAGSSLTQSVLPPLLFSNLFGVLAPRGGLAPGLCAAANEAGWCGAAAQWQELQREMPVTGPPRTDTTMPQTPTPKGGADDLARALPDWGTILVGFVAGLIVAPLAALQLAEWRRRRLASRTPKR
jgi:hypothetical protein